MTKTPKIIGFLLALALPPLALASTGDGSLNLNLDKKSEKCVLLRMNKNRNLSASEQAFSDCSQAEKSVCDDTQRDLLGGPNAKKLKGCQGQKVAAIGYCSSFYSITGGVSTAPGGAEIGGTIFCAMGGGSFMQYKNMVECQANCGK